MIMDRRVTLKLSTIHLQDCMLLGPGLGSPTGCIPTSGTAFIASGATVCTGAGAAAVLFLAAMAAHENGLTSSAEI